MRENLLKMATTLPGYFKMVEPCLLYHYTTIIIVILFPLDTWTKYEHNDKMEEILEKSRGKKYGYTFLYRNDTQ